MTTGPPLETPTLRAPIVLAHGLLGFAKIRIAGITLASYFRRIPQHLQRAGNRVLQTGVHPTGSIERRAETLKKQIRANLGDEPVHIIAHSLGGFDARRMITHLDMASQVISLTTLSTPHHGSAFANTGVSLGRRMGVLRLLGLLRLDHRAVFELNYDACARFNEQTPDAPGVRYFSVAGDKPRREMEWILRPPHRIIEAAEGPNDGLVSVRSAEWGESLTIWRCDHVDMVGWSTPMEWLLGRSVDVRPLYSALLHTLVECE
ncbi:MAG: hypothetical protein KAS72_06630 [Phycisphaerales bacterium]|nr:hypothetical protein [Phycisphaerales bacterium]